MEETEKKEFDIWVYIWKNRSIAAFMFSIVALGLSGYNTYQIGGGVAVPSNAQGAMANVEKPEKILKELPKGAPVLGNPNAKLTIVEFADFQCPFCGKFHKEVYPTIKSKYIDTGKVKFVYLDFAFLGQESLDASEASRCAGEQGKFWEYHDEIYNNQKSENQGAFNSTVLKKFATNVGLDMARFNECTADTRYDKSIADEQLLAKKYGVNGTPGFLIGKQTVKGAGNIENFLQVIDSQL